MAEVPETAQIAGAAAAEEPQDVPVLVTLGSDDVPVCADGSCAL